MAVNRRYFLMFAANDSHVYEDPGKREMSKVGFADDITAEKRIAPVPVGAKSAKDFCRKCVGCMKCITACPAEILRPSANAAHFGRPALDFRFGWCRLDCNKCAEACPAGAIDRNIVGELKKTMRTGIAVWHQERCIAANGKDICKACTRHCPVKAIKLVDGPKGIQVPLIDSAKCIGCGKCEYYCPARPKAAITVEGRE